MSEPAGVVILTPMTLEYKAVREQLRDRRQIWHEGGTSAEVGTVTGVSCPVAVVLTGEGDQAGIVAGRVAAWLRPRMLLLVGVAGGLNEDIELGDVVVGTWVYGYHSGKETSEGLAARPRVWPTDHWLVQAAQLAEIKDAWTAPGEAHPSVHFKPIASGEVLLSSRAGPLMRQLRQNYNDAAAIEMESAGVASAAQLNGSLPTLTIRGISDAADERKQASDGAGWQPRAAANAAAFALAVLRELAESGRLGPPDASGGAEPQDGELPWRPLPQPLPAIWPSDLGVPRQVGFATVELCLLPVDPGPPLEIRRLAALPAELAALGRARGVFGPDVEVAQAGGPAAIASVAGAGLAVTPRGERCGWQPLPQDTDGAVLDEADLTAQLARLLSLLSAIEVPHPREAAVAVGVAPSVLLAEGSLPRTSVRGRTSLTPLRVPATDAVTWTRITTDPADLAAELSARLLWAFRSLRHSSRR
jgi:nucleoside phosphorylase